MLESTLPVHGTITHITYKIIDRGTGEYYLGRCSIKTWKYGSGYYGSGIEWRDRIKRYRGAGTLHKHFRREVLGCYTSFEDSLAAEKALITTATLTDPLCVNRSTGGKGGQHTPESCAKIGRANKGRKWSFARRYHASLQRIGRKKGQIKPFPRKPLSQEARDKISLAKKGRKMSARARAAISRGHIGIRPTRETWLKLKAAQMKRGRGVITPAGIFATVALAASHHGIARQSLRNRITSRNYEGYEYTDQLD